MRRTSLRLFLLFRRHPIHSSLSFPSPFCSSSSSSSSSSCPPYDVADVLRRWGGLTDSEASLVLDRHPFLRRSKVPNFLSKIQLLTSLGIRGPGLFKLIIARSRLLAGRIAGGGHDLHDRLRFLATLFHPCSSDDHEDDNDNEAAAVPAPPPPLVLRAILRNPSMLNYDVEKTMRPCVELYESVGIGRREFGRLLLIRPTLVRRSSLDDEKRELIRRTGLEPDDPMYKYAVSIVAISRLGTLQAKIANLEKFGFSSDEVLALFARHPNILTFSIDKIQRNMTYILGTVRLPPGLVLHHPVLLYCNLERVLRPRHLVCLKLQEMGLEPVLSLGPGMSLLSAVRMKEQRFVDKFIMCHQDSAVVGELMEYYSRAKELKRLAESSKSKKKEIFPF